jgi:hypothetical protein
VVVVVVLLQTLLLLHLVLVKVVDLVVVVLVMLALLLQVDLLLQGKVTSAVVVLELLHMLAAVAAELLLLELFLHLEELVELEQRLLLQALQQRMLAAVEVGLELLDHLMADQVVEVLEDIQELEMV